MKKVAKKTTGLKNVLKVDEGEVRTHLDAVVRQSVEETLNGMLDAEADQLCQAKRYERTPERVDTRAGSYERSLHTKAGEVTLKVPKLRSLPFETQIIERYRRRESSVEEALIEMYLAEVVWGQASSPQLVDTHRLIFGSRDFRWAAEGFSSRPVTSSFFKEGVV